MVALAYLVALLAGVAGTVAGVAGVLGRGWSLSVAALVPLGGLELTMDPLAGLMLALNRKIYWANSPPSPSASKSTRNRCTIGSWE